MMNEEFLTELAKKELGEPGRWKSPGVPVKQQNETKKHLLIPTAQGPPHVASNIRGLLLYPPKEKNSMGKIGKWLSQMSHTQEFMMNT